MTIPFGRRRLIVTLAVSGTPRRSWADGIPPETGDLELARLAKGGAVDIERARWETLTLIYGGRPQR